MFLEGRRDEAQAAIAAFNEATGHAYEGSDFAEYRGARSLEEFAAEAARPAHPRVPDVTATELAEVVRRIQDADEETDHYVRVLRANVPHPAPTDLIFWPPPGLEEATAEEIVDAALRHRPIAL